jgi:hypothetical protein
MTKKVGDAQIRIKKSISDMHAGQTSFFSVWTNISIVTTKKNHAINHVIIIIYRPGRLVGSPRDDANVPTTIHNTQTAHSAIANTRFCSISTEAELETSSGPRWC